MIRIYRTVVIPGLFSLLLFPALGQCKVITSDTVWSGEVSVDQDILVPEGVTLTIAPGTNILVSASESTKTDPEYMSPLTEITVRGTLISEGTADRPVSFRLNGSGVASWAGIIVDGGKVSLGSSTIRDAETGIFMIHGSLSLQGSVLTNNRYGLVVQGVETSVVARSSRISENDYGVVLLNGAKLVNDGTVVKGNKKKDSYSASAKDSRLPEKEYAVKTGPEEKANVYGDQALLGLTVWQGKVRVNGIVRVPENSRLIILPGTLVEFTRKDTNSDGIGEQGLLIQGVIIAKGTKEAPIVFRSAEKQKRMGDWDSINIMNSDKAQNLIEYCQIEDAYRGLHFHFSNVSVSNAILKNNYRGIQFQESVVEIRHTAFYANKSAVQARDSEIVFTGNLLFHNYSGMNIFRNSIVLRDNVIVNNYQEGIRVREGLPMVDHNLIDSNRYGLSVVDALYGTFDNNVISHNLESGIALKGTVNIGLNGNFLQGNGLNGISIQDSSAFIKGNLISGNGDRGIGILSFRGVITGNNILQNGLYNLGIDGDTDVQAASNWWGGEDLHKTIYDREDDASKGKAEYEPALEKPIIFPWPLKTVPTDTVWHGAVSIGGSVSVTTGTNLVVSAGTRVLFDKGAGLDVKGRIRAAGEKNAPVTFTSLKAGGAGEWDEILLEYAKGSIFSYCYIEHATWGLHSHFTDLRVDRCSFQNNYGGMRFRSGPVEVRGSSFTGNEIGIRAYWGNALITGNEITGNRIGIFVREKGGGLAIHQNNIFANSDYGIRIGDFNLEDVDAKDNWWGGMTPAAAILDGVTEPGIGKVIFEPYAKERFHAGHSPDRPGGGAGLVKEPSKAGAVP